MKREKQEDGIMREERKKNIERGKEESDVKCSDCDRRYSVITAFNSTILCVGWKTDSKISIDY